MIKSYCKINLSLRVLKKLRNKMHDIETNTVLIDLYDKIFITKIKKKEDQIVFKGKFKEAISKSNNTVKKTIFLLREKKYIKNNVFYKIIVEKGIPVFAGLGGGTSNSAHIIKHFIKKKINNSIIQTFEKKIGSDLRLFFNKQLHQKKLKKINKYKKNFPFFILLVYPNLKCSTKKIFANVRKYSSPSNINFSRIKSTKEFIQLIKNEKNDLQKVVENKFPLIKKVIKFVNKQNECNFARMTGSGSVCFGVFNDYKSAKSALTIVKRMFPKYWCVVTKTI